MTSFDNLTNDQKIRASIHKDTRSICSESCHLLGLDITKQAMEIIAELVYKKMAAYGADLEAFSKHAKRQTINSDDVKLLVRRNPSLLSRITSLATNTATKEKRRKTLVAKQPVTPKPKEKDSAGNSEMCEKSPVLHQLLTDQTTAREDVEPMVMDLHNTIDLTFD